MALPLRFPFSKLLGPLFSAIKYQKTEAVECLLKAGTRTVDVNLQDKAGMTALHHASKESYRYRLLVSVRQNAWFCCSAAVVPPHASRTDPSRHDVGKQRRHRTTVVL